MADKNVLEPKTSDPEGTGTSVRCQGRAAPRGPEPSEIGTAAGWPLVGRGAAFTALASALAEDPPRSVVIAGPVGSGRTRMAREALSLVEQRGRRVGLVAATAATARVPLGALAHLLPVGDVTSDPLVLLQRAAQVLSGDGPGSPPVLGVDDVHLLDDLSVTLLHQLAASRLVTLVLTVRTGTIGPDPVAPLWKDELATRVELAPLGRSDTFRLLVTVLDGHVETRTLERLWQLTQGNPLFLREIVEDGQRTQSLRRSEGLWRWEGPMVPSQRLTEIVMTQMGDLDTSEWRALEALAHVGSVGVQQLVELGDLHAVASLQRRGLVLDDGAPGRLRPAHPIYAAVVRGRSSEAGAHLVIRRLAEEEADWGDGPVRRCLALLHSGMPVTDPVLLNNVARRALAGLDLPAAARLAREARRTGAGFDATLVLVEALRWLGDKEAERLAAESAGRAGSDADRARLVLARAFAMLPAADGHDRAMDALANGMAAVHRPEYHALLEAARSIVALFAGDVRRSAERAEAVRSSVPRGTPAWLLATAGSAAGLALAGRTGKALEAVAAARAALESAPSVAELVLIRILLAHAEAIALCLAGRIEELGQRAEELHQSVLATPEWAGDGIACLQFGVALLASGRVHQATQWLEEAYAGLQRQDPIGMRGLCIPLLAIARLLTDDVQAARTLLDGHGDDARDVLPLFRPLLTLAGAHLAEAEGHGTESGRLTFEAVADAAAQGQVGVQALILHSAVRSGMAEDVAAPLALLAAEVDAPLIGDLAAHAAAAAAADAVALEEASEQLARAGALRKAADAVAEAAVVHERHGARRRAGDCRSRAMFLLRTCGLVDSPVLGRLELPTLTLREEEVAELASQGLPNQAIADRLVLSVRTVEAHLSHIYMKFGITSRAELEAALKAAPSKISTRRTSRRMAHH